MNDAGDTHDQTSPVAGGSVLSGDQVRKLGIILRPDDNGWRPCSYDLSVETVIGHRGKILPFDDDSVEIPAHGMVEVIAREQLKMPGNVVGYAMVKTGLTVNGIFALNIGIIDPHYEGGVSTTLINFGKNPFSLVRGCPFLRLTFHALSGDVPKDEKLKCLDQKQYLNVRKGKAKQHFSETFLDIATTAESAARHIVDDWQKKILIWAPAFVILLSVAAFGSTFYLNLSQVVGTHRHSVTNTEVQNICVDVARFLQEKQGPKTALSDKEAELLCLQRASKTKTLQPAVNDAGSQLNADAGTAQQSSNKGPSTLPISGTNAGTAGSGGGSRRP